MFADPRRHNDQILGHFIAGEQFTKLGNEQSRLQMAGQLLQLPHVFGRRMPHQIANRPFLPRFVESRLDDFDNRLRALHIVDIGLGEALIDIGQVLAVGRFAAQHFDVASQ